MGRRIPSPITLVTSPTIHDESTFRALGVLEVSPVHVFVATVLASVWSALLAMLTHNAFKQQLHVSHMRSIQEAISMQALHDDTLHTEQMLSRTESGLDCC